LRPAAQTLTRGEEFGRRKRLEDAYNAARTHIAEHGGDARVCRSSGMQMGIFQSHGPDALAPGVSPEGLVARIESLTDGVENDS